MAMVHDLWVGWAALEDMEGAFGCVTRHRPCRRAKRAECHPNLNLGMKQRSNALVRGIAARNPRTYDSQS